MKTIKLMLAITMVNFVMGCGDLEQDPTKGYEAVNSAEIPRDRVYKPETTMGQLYSITPVGDFTFVQGEKNKIIFFFHKCKKLFPKLG